MGILLLCIFVLAVAIKTPRAGFAILAGYLVMHVLYSLKLKDIVIVDVLTIAAGFLFRVLAGAIVISVGVSSWLILCTFSVAIFLALGKRRHEVVILSGDATNHRPVLESYSVAFLDQLLQIATTSTFLFYCLYSVLPHPSSGPESEKMMYTIPFVTYGIFRYLYLIYHKEDGGSPTVLLLTDPPLLLCAVLWMAACVAVIYW
jgi:4-hydroxybenzoate polyprenyltransferase